MALAVIVRPRRARCETAASEEETPRRLHRNGLAKRTLRVPVGPAAVEVKEAVGALGAALVWVEEVRLGAKPGHRAVVLAEPVILLRAARRERSGERVRRTARTAPPRAHTVMTIGILR